MENLVNARPERNFWAGRRVLVTGHTGFKGAWLCLLLQQLGAQVSGLALAPTTPSAFALLQVERMLVASHYLDMRTEDSLIPVVHAIQPEIVFHLAAQALVGASYRDPSATFATNVNGTIHLLQALRGLESVTAAVIVTSDKVYRNDNSGRPFIESDPLGGNDPYSASKAAAELVVASWRYAFAAELPALATARAGNVIGGGDFAAERLIPDLVRALQAQQALQVRQPDSTRPFQHVLDVLVGYLLLAEGLVKRPSEMPTALNFGPQDGELRVRDLLHSWEQATASTLNWTVHPTTSMPEQKRLALSSQLAAHTLDWQARHSTAAAVAASARWYQAWLAGQDMHRYSVAEAKAALLID